MRVPFSSDPHQHLLLVFLMVAILTGVSWNPSVVLNCFSFMARDGEHFFMCFLAIWSSFEKVLFSSVGLFFIGSLISLGSSVFGLPAYSGYQSLISYIASKIFLSFSVWPPQLRDNFFVVQKLFNFM
jgi:hypothetical protein